MSYENKEYILQFFEGVHEKESRAELIEVYRKAKAWDNMKRDFEEISHTPMAQHILFNMSLIMEDVESGESDAEK